MSSRISSFARTTIFCRDIEKSLVLYRDTLGLRVVDDKTLNGPAIGRMIGLESCRLRIIHLQVGEGQGPFIGLYGVLEPDLSTAPLPDKGLHRGNVAIVLHSDAPEEIAREVSARGYTFLTPPTDYPTKTGGASRVPGTITEMIFYDPDGVLVSIIGFRPAS